MTHDSVEQPTSEQPLPSLARSASILSLGNVASRALGLARETVIADLFGASGAVSAFRLASRVPTMVYDLLVGGMLSAAIVPVLSDLARPSRRDELWQAASAVLSLLVVLLGGVVIAIELLAQPLASLLGSGLSPQHQAITARSLRILAPTILIFGSAGFLTALLYALRRFTFPAIAAASFNLGIVVAAPLLAGRIGIDSLSVGILLGSLVQFLIQLPGLRDSRIRFRWSLQHPAIRHIGKLYLPVAIGLVVGQVQVLIDGNLATRTGERSVAWMQAATTLREFPLGLVSLAVSLAALPTLSQYAADLDWVSYKNTLARGIRLVVVLTLPAATGLAVLAGPLVGLVFEHGEFSSFDTFWTSRALVAYLPGLVFAAIDWPLNYAYYARQNTRTPTIVGIAAAGVYLIVALLLMRPLGMIGLVIADSTKHVFHALVMLVLLRRDLGTLAGEGMGSVALKSALASLIMGALAWNAIAMLQNVLGSTALWAEVALVGLAGTGGALVYAALLKLLRVPEIEVVFSRLLSWGKARAS